MKISIYQKHTSFNTLYFSEIVIDCKGTGTKADPAIIEPSEDLPDVIYLMNSNMHIHIRNLKKRFISLSDCSNIILKDCELKYCDVFNCSFIKVENLSITKLFRLYSSRDVSIQDSTIEKMKIKQSNSNTIKNCSFKKVNRTLSSDNIFESVFISGNQVNEVKQRGLIDFINKWNLKFLLYLIILYISVLVVVPSIIRYEVPIQLHFIAVGICIFLLYLTWRKK